MSHEEDKVIIIKTGSDATLNMSYTDNSDPPNPIPLNNYAIFVDFINPKTRVALAKTYYDPFAEGEISSGINITDFDGGKFRVEAGNTSTWPLGDIPVDILYSIEEANTHTETFIIRMVQGISKK